MADPIHSHAINAHKYWSSDCILSVLRGFRNGAVTGVRVRIPYIMQAAAYVLMYADQGSKDRLRFVLKQMFLHGHNLGLFVAIYKSLVCVFRNMNFSGGLESLIAGFIGGYFAFGENKGVSGAVNTQLVLYLFARGIQGLIQTGVKYKQLPQNLSWTSSQGFRIWAGFSLALALYMTEYQPECLQGGLLSVMKYLYHQSDSGPILQPVDRNFWPFVAVIIFSICGSFSPALRLENLLNRFI